MQTFESSQVNAAPETPASFTFLSTKRLTWWQGLQLETRRKAVSEGSPRTIFCSAVPMVLVFLFVFV
jgi:hypothetical protein